ncbi:hypothetical protein AB6D75_01095 [Vibrio splendidus]
MQNIRIYSWFDEPNLPLFSSGLKLSELVEEFRSQYDYVKLYHLCRPLDVERYYSHGIEAGNQDLLELNLKHILDSLGLELTSDVIELLNKRKYPSNGSIYSVFDYRFLLEDGFCGHYGTHGSEHLCSVFQALGYNRELLTEIGKAAIISFVYPIDRLHPYELSNLVEGLCEADFTDSSEMKYDIRIDSSVEPKYIVDIEFPESVKAFGRTYLQRN